VSDVAVEKRTMKVYNKFTN